MERGRLCAAELGRRRDELCGAVYRARLLTGPGASAKFGPAGGEAPLRDIGRDLDHLAAALRYGAPELFASYVGWLAAHNRGLGHPDEDLGEGLLALASGIGELLSTELAEPALALLRAPLPAPPPSLEAEEALRGEAGAYLELLLGGDRAGALGLVEGLLDGGRSLPSLYLEVFQASQVELGRLWLAGRVSVAQEHFCTAATQFIISRLYPRLFSGAARGPGVLAACVGGELHELGIRMVADFLELAGFSTSYLGANLPRSGFVAALGEREVGLLCLSASLVTSLPELEALIAEIRLSRSREELPILVGGRPFSAAPELWSRVGADGWARDAKEAVDVAKAFLE